MTIRLGLATAGNLPKLWHDDALLLDALQEAGLAAEPLVWTKPPENYPEIVLVRSVWDYVPVVEDFILWLRETDKQSRLLNPLSLQLWNIDKRYLIELFKKGLPVVPSYLLKKGENYSLNTLGRDLGFEEMVIKPVFSSTSYGTIRTKPADPAGQEHLDQWVARENMLLQPFLPEVLSSGELSLVYIDGQYTHTVLKKGKGDDFRVQEEFGGTTDPIEARPKAKQVADQIVAAMPNNLAYARVDLIAHQGNYLLGELELIEPELFFRYCPQAIEGMVARLQREGEGLRS